MAIAPFANKPLRVVAGLIFQFWPIHDKIRRIETTAMNKRTLMNKRTCLLTFVVAASFLLSTPATAGVLYDNGLIPTNIGKIGEWGIYYNDVVSDSFTLAGTSTLTGVNLDISIASGDIPDHLYWRISDSFLSAADNTDHGTEASLTDVTTLCIGCVSLNNSSANLYSASFSLGSLVEGPGDHFLTLNWSSYLYWDISNGPSEAYLNGVNAQTGVASVQSNSNSFQILGTSETSTSAPEPASVAMLLSGLALVAGLTRRQMRG